MRVCHQGLLSCIFFVLVSALLPLAVLGIHPVKHTPAWWSCARKWSGHSSQDEESPEERHKVNLALWVHFQMSTTLVLQQNHSFSALLSYNLITKSRSTTNNGKMSFSECCMFYTIPWTSNSTGYTFTQKELQVIFYVRYMKPCDCFVFTFWEVLII